MGKHAVTDFNGRKCEIVGVARSSNALEKVSSGRNYNMPGRSETSISNKEKDVQSNPQELLESQVAD